MKAKAAVLFEAGKRLELCDVDVEAPHAGEVLIRMAAGGVCHSDLHVMTGHLGAQLPAVLGHEGSGVVADVGPGVTSVKPGPGVATEKVWCACASIGNLGNPCRDRDAAFSRAKILAQSAPAAAWVFGGSARFSCGSPRVSNDARSCVGRRLSAARGTAVVPAARSACVLLTLSGPRAEAEALASSRT